MTPDADIGRYRSVTTEEYADLMDTLDAMRRGEPLVRPADFMEVCGRASERTGHMIPNQTVLVACRISRSAFSGERVVKVIHWDGDEELFVVPVDDCLRIDREPLGSDEPEKGHQVGFVRARWLGKTDDRVKVAIGCNERAEVVSSVVPCLERVRIEYIPITEDTPT